MSSRWTRFGRSHDWRTRTRRLVPQSVTGKVPNPAVMSWMAVPLFDPVRRRVEAVLYVDSTERHFFTETRQELILDAASGIAVFIVAVRLFRTPGFFRQRPRGGTPSQCVGGPL